MMAQMVRQQQRTEQQRQQGMVPVGMGSTLPALRLDLRLCSSGSSNVLQDVRC
jgi:hypothetical protein